MKKILLTLGTVAAIAAPITTVVSCGVKTPVQETPTNTEGAKPSTQEDAQANTNGGKTPTQETTKTAIGGDNVQTLTDENNGNQNIDFSNEKNPFANVKEDGLFLWDKTYSGKLWSDDTIANGVEVTGVRKIHEQHGYDWDPTVQFGKWDPSDETEIEDSVYMVYDNDDLDGMNMDNFTDTVYFEDPSVAMEDEIYKANTEIFGNISKEGNFGGKAQYVSFKEDPNIENKGQINFYHKKSATF